MKFKKSAKDITGRIIKKGDILLYPEDSETIESVVIDIKQNNREIPPQLTVKKIIKDWLGRLNKIKTVDIDINLYKKGRVVDPDNLRDDVISHQKLKTIYEKINE